MIGIVTLTVAGQTFGRRMPLPCRSGRIPPLLHRLGAELTKFAAGHCQTNWNRPAKGAGLRCSGRQLTPLGQDGRTALFEDVASVEVSLSSSVYPSFVVITAWVTLLYVVGLAEYRAVTSIGWIGLESLALEQVARVRYGSKADILRGRV
jgi:hypothetical protein